MAELGDTLSGALWMGEVSVLLYVLYRCGLGLLSLRSSGPAGRGAGATTFLILVSAHDEDDVISKTVASLLRLDYPENRRSVLVVADDCRDRTEQAARAAGALVLTKPGPARGKGRVIQWALAQPEVSEASWDALVLFDADSKPAPDFLCVLDGAISRGWKAIQGRCESPNQGGWVERGHALNNSQRNRTWHQAREAAGFSAVLTGTGTCLTRDVLQAVPPAAKTLTEDLEYTALLTRAGIRAHYIHDTVVQIEQPHSLRSSVRQRLRWARGQILTALAHCPGLLWRAVRRRDISAFDTALYLALPSLTPLQAGLLIWIAGDALLPGIWPRARIGGLPEIPASLLLFVLAFSLLLPSLGLLAEHRRAGWRDWLAFGFLMASWLPIAAFAAMTTWVQTWHRTPHGSLRAAAIPPAELQRREIEEQPSISRESAP